MLKEHTHASDASLQFRKRAKDVLLCCTDRALTLLLHVLSLGPADIRAAFGRGCNGRLRRVAAIADAADFLAAPKAAACARHAAIGKDTALCGPLPEPGVSSPQQPPSPQGPPPRVSAFLPVDDDCEVLAVLSGRRGVVGNGAGSAREASAGGAAQVPQPEGSESSLGGSRRRRTDSSLAEATAAAETLTQLISAARAAALQRSASGDEPGSAAAAAPAQGSSPFVSEVLQEAQRALTQCSDAQARLQHTLETGAAAADAPVADAGADAQAPPAKARRVLPAEPARVPGVLRAAGAPANWTQPETPAAPVAGANAWPDMRRSSPFEGVADATTAAPSRSRSTEARTEEDARAQASRETSERTAGAAPPLCPLTLWLQAHLHSRRR